MSRYTSCAQIGIYHVQTPIIAEKLKVFGSKLSSARILKSNSNSSTKTNLILMCVKQISKTQHPELDFLFPFTALPTKHTKMCTQYTERAYPPPRPVSGMTKK